MVVATTRRGVDSSWRFVEKISEASDVGETMMLATA